MVVAYLAPLGFLPLLSLRWAAGGLLVLVMNILSSTPAQHSLLRQSAGAAIPFLFAAMIASLAKLRAREDLKSVHTKAGRLLPVIIVATMVISAANADFSDASRTSDVAWPGQHEKAIDRVIALIPDGATVTANNSIFPHLSNRTDTYLPRFTDPYTPLGTHSQWGFPDMETDYVVVDRVHRQLIYPGVYWESTVIEK